jgi:cytochrome P450
MLLDRQKLGSSKRDIFRHLLAEDSETGCRFTQAELNSNANLIILAGADTTSSTMTQIFRVLAKEQKILKRIQKEVDHLCGNGERLTVESTRNLPYVNAVVNEALRLFNPIPCIHAVTSSSVVQINDMYLPGDVQVQIPHLVLMTDERYFPQGDKFITEQWTNDRPDLLLDRVVYIRFGYGVHSCVGKQLALNEIRLTISRVAKDFNVTFGASYDETKFVEEWRDYGILQIGKVYLKFTRRQ